MYFFQNNRYKIYLVPGRCLETVFQAVVPEMTALVWLFFGKETVADRPPLTINADRMNVIEEADILNIRMLFGKVITYGAGDDR